MQFGPKTRIDRYEIHEPIGAGGMGEVYRGLDTRLGRAVAIKVLRSDLLQARDLKQRLAHEAHVLSTMNHPNICTLHDVVDVNGQPALIMELLEGETLAQRLGTGSVTLEESVRIGAQVASALGAAHKKGILHRDIKPGNIFLTTSGHVKVLDFGLAKLLADVTRVQEYEATRSLDSSPMTAPGALLGTFAFMAPEQALGESIDPRSDIYSLGVVLYELCTGQRPFSGKTLPALFDAVLHDNPEPARKRNPKIGAELDAIIHRAIQRDPLRRQQTAGELEQELLRVRNGEPRRGNPALKSVIIGIGILVASAIATYLFRLQRPEANVVVGVSQLTEISGQELFPSLAPDAKTFVFVSQQQGNWDIYSQRVGGRNSTNLTADSTQDDTQPAFSADGERIAFRSERDGGGIFVMGATGESVRKVADFGYNPSWSPDGKQLVVASEGVIDSVNRGRSSELWTIDVQTGKKTRLYEGDAVQPNWSPHGNRIAFWSGLSGRREVKSISSTGGNPAVVAVADAEVNWNPVWSPDGRFLYYLSNKGGSMNLWRISINEGTGAVKQPPQPVTTPAIDAAHLTFARTANRGMYVQRFSAANIHRIKFDGKVTSGAPTQVTRGTKTLLVSDVSADGEWIAFMSSGAQEDIYVIRSDGSGLRQLTNDAHKDRRPRWAPDGKRLIFDSNRSGRVELWEIHPDGSALTQLTRTSGPPTFQAVWSNDGKEVAFTRGASAPGVLNLATAEIRSLPALAAGETWNGLTSWSQDGRGLAFHTIGPKGPSGIGIHWLKDGSVLRLTNQGAAPVWLADSRRLLYETGIELHLIDSQTRSDQVIMRTDPYVIELGSRSGGVRDWIYFSLLTNEADIWSFDLQ
jgi:eukaryotic-like serine/threonine-protein kinase